MNCRNRSRGNGATAENFNSNLSTLSSIYPALVFPDDLSHSRRSDVETTRYLSHGPTTIVVQLCHVGPSLMTVSPLQAGLKRRVYSPLRLHRRFPFCSHHGVGKVLG